MCIRDSDNAVRFSPDGAVIRLSVARRGADVCFTVADSGCGIPADDQTRLFDRYWKGPTQRRSGTGLGLSIARGIVQAHGGAIWVESTVGVGSAFSFTLPTAEAPAASAVVAPPSATAAAPLAGRRVLVVDDEPYAVRALGILLGVEGLVVSTATSGEQALAALDAARPDVLVVDVEMPGMTGLELIERVRARRPGLPVVVMSGYTAAQRDVRAALVGDRVGYVEKPIDVDKLLDVLGRLSAA